MRGQDDDGKSRRLLADFVKQGQTVHSAHLEVGNDQLGARGREHGEGLLPAVRSLDAVARGGKSQGNEFQDIGIVVDEKNGAHLGRACLRSMILCSIGFSDWSCSLVLTFLW